MNENLKKPGKWFKLFNQIDKPLAKIDNIQFASNGSLFIRRYARNLPLDRRGQSIDGELVNVVLLLILKLL